MVLVIMVGILCYRVYQILDPPPPPPPPPNHSFPSDVVPEDRSLWDAPPECPAPPAGPQLVDYTSLYRRNPFWVYAADSRARKDDEAGDATDDIGISLVRIRKMPDGTSRAEIQTKGRNRGWYREGEEFESFQLLSIDATAQTCEVYAEELGKRIILQAP